MKITIKVVPNSKAEEVFESKEGELIVRVKEPAEKGKANKAVIKLLSKYFKKKVRIVSGLMSRKKIVRLE